MKVVVPVKRVVDHNVKVRITADQTGVDRTNVKMSMNPFDEIAVEAAIRLKEAGIAHEIVVVSIGTADAAETIRTALGMGADRGILVTAAEDIEPLAAAKILRAVCAEEQPRLVITGKQSIDDDAAQTGPMLAALLGWAQATQASTLTIGEHTATVVCETEDGLQTLEVRLPAVVTCDLRLNEPRYVSLPGKMKARTKPIVTKPAAAYGVDTTPRLAVLGVAEPARRPPGIKVASVGALLDKLHQAGAL